MNHPARARAGEPPRGAMASGRETRDTDDDARSRRRTCAVARARGRGLVPGDGEVRLVDVMHHARAREHRRECDAVYAQGEHARGRVSWWKTGPEIRSRPMRRFVRACEPFFGGGGLRGVDSRRTRGRRRSMLKRLNLGCADRRQKPGARRPDHSESGVADVEAGGVDMDEQARPQTGRRPLDRISSPPPRDRALVSFRAPDAAPAPHTTPPIPRDGPAGVRGGRRAHHARRSREAQPTTHHASTRHGHQTRARVSVPRPRHHDSRHGDATDIRAAHRRLRARRAGGGFEARRRRRRRLERADDDNWRRRRREARGRRAREREAGAPRRSPGGRTPNITRRGIVREMVRERWVGERRRERFGDGSANGSAKRDGERNRSPRRTARLTRASPIR